MTNDSIECIAEGPRIGNEAHSHPELEVRITINGIHKFITRGLHTVKKIKLLGGVPLADELEEVIHEKLTPLPDDGSVEIKGGEIFIGHPKDSGSS